MSAAVASEDMYEEQMIQKPPVEKNASFESLPAKKNRRLNFSRLETAPQESWKALKKWVGGSFQSQPTAKPSIKLESINIERQIELNTLFPLILAMTFSKDENNEKRIPVFLNQLTVKVDISDDERDEDSDDSSQSIKKRVKKRKFRPTFFKIQVQYGDGPKKITWSVYRRYWDFVRLHYQYRRRYNLTREKVNRNLLKNKTKPPKFPSIPKRHLYRRKQPDDVPHTNPNSILDEEGVMALVSVNQNDHTATATGSALTSIRPLLLPQDTNSPSSFNSPIVDVVKVDPFVLNDMEEYLNQFIATIPPCGNTNRLCKFLEISALGLHLTSRYPNQAYHGKEGFAVFQSRTDHDPKQAHKFLQDGIVCSLPTTGGRRRRKPKWFIVRESYIVCVNDPSESEIYDVFLFDQEFDIHRLDIFGDKSKHRSKNGKKKFSNALANASHWTSGKATLCFKNTQGVYHFRAKNEQQARQFEKSIRYAASLSMWTKDNRFGSYAPVRHHSAVSWFVDGRDYFWDVSVALENAKECIYIHDWWLSPELFLRRPAAKNLEWRLDRVLRRKADQGVKVYIVMYKEVAMALPLFSHQAKRHLLSLSPNIFVQRHPSRALDIFHKDSIFFWAHHEKICVIDNEVAFIGGLDLCFGRWDTPRHILVDDLDSGLNSQVQHPQIWPGKDYSNPRIIDFHTLDKPFEDNQDRTTLPRMPWHDISMRVVGASARDISRHFIQRWNFLRRKKPNAPKRPTPMLLPVPDRYINSITKDDPRICHPFTSENCHVQILRSVSPWSIGSTDRIEHSIQTAYCESIKSSEHFIYIENQFFVSATKNGTVTIENKIGDAIFERILRAFREGRKWRAIIVVPLVPGFPANIDETEATTVRLIMQYQYYSISRGPNSILSRLHDAGVYNTHEYINIYGLRNWAELNGQFVTEQVYIHSKTMIVDDRKVIIGSANINERSQLGTRDSEIAAHIEEDKDLIDSTLNGQPVKVGRFAHTLRIRLMSEHIGLDVDQMDRDRFSKTTSNYLTQRLWSDYELSDDDKNDSINCVPPFIQVTKNMEHMEKEKEQIQQEEKDEIDINEIEKSYTHGSSDSEDTIKSDHNEKTHIKTKPFKSKRKKLNTFISKNDIEDQEKKVGQQAAEANAASGERRLSIEPLKTSNSSSTSKSNDATSALSPSKSIFGKRKSTKEDYLDFWTSLDPDTDNNGDTQAHKHNSNEKLAENYYNSLKLEDVKLKDKTIGDILNILKDPLTDEFQDFWHLLARFNTDLFRRSFLVVPDNNVRTWDQFNHFVKMAKLFLGRTDLKHGGTKTTVAATNVTSFPLNKDNGGEASIRDIIRHIRGHLVIWPNHFMEDDDVRGDFLFNVDKIAPIEIFD